MLGLSGDEGFLQTIALVLFIGICLACQSTENGKAQASVVSVPDLGFRYTPPAGLTDKTSPSSREARNHAGSYTGKAAEVILDMSSDDADADQNWHQLWMFIFPRANLAGLDDAAAEAKMNAALASPRSIALGKPQTVARGGRNFLVSEFEQKEAPLVKHARIFTAVCKGQLVSFVLVSNSADQVSAMEQSLNSLNFPGR